MSCKNGKAAAFGSRGLPELDLLASAIDRENNSASAQAQATPITVTIRGPTVAKGRPRFTHSGIAYTPAKTRKYEAHGRQAALRERCGLEAFSDILPDERANVFQIIREALQ